MDTKQLNAPTSGAIHVRTRHTENFTILANRLAQRPGSAITVGVAAFIISKPDGASITIASLRAHFTEGETLLGRALNELEAEGWLERRLERGSDGRLTTRTFVYDDPARAATRPTAPMPAPAPAPVPDAQPLPSVSLDPRPALQAYIPQPRREPSSPASPAASPAARPSAVTALSALSSRDPRLVLTRSDLDRLGPGVQKWLDQGLWPDEITTALAANLPARPVHLLAWRLREPPPLPAPQALSPAPPPPEPPKPRVVPLQNCDGCDRAFRSPNPGHCPGCLAANVHANGAAAPASAPDDGRNR